MSPVGVVVCRTSSLNDRAAQANGGSHPSLGSGRGRGSPIFAVIAGVVILFPSLGLLLHALSGTARPRRGGGSRSAITSRGNRCLERRPARRSSWTSLLAGFGLLTIADARLAHLIGVMSLLAFIEGWHGDADRAVREVADALRLAFRRSRMAAEYASALRVVLDRARLRLNQPGGTIE